MAQLRLSVIRPQPINHKAMLQQLYDGMQELGEDIRDDFERTVKTWNDKPVFDPIHNKPLQKTNMIYVETTTTQLKYKWIVKGTKTKPGINIVPVRAKALRYPGTFYPKSIPGLIDATPGFSGPPIVFSGGVHHPGVEARHFDKDIQKKQTANAKQIMGAAILMAASSSRHAL